MLIMRSIRGWVLPLILLVHLRVRPDGGRRTGADTQVGPYRMLRSE